MLLTILLAIALWWGMVRMLEARSTWTLTKWMIRLTPGVKLRNYSRTRLFSHTLGALLDAGLPLMDSLQFLQGSSGPAWLVHAAQVAHWRLLQGQTIREAFSGNWHISMPVVMGWAEHSGDLPSAFKRIEELSSHAVDVRVRLILHLLEPVFILLLGGLILYTVTLVFVPLYDVLGQVLQFGASR